MKGFHCFCYFACCIHGCEGFPHQEEEQTARICDKALHPEEGEITQTQ